jgi:predicted secreted Zn-dependent protease
MDELIDPWQSFTTQMLKCISPRKSLPPSVAVVHDTNLEVHFTHEESPPSVAVVHDTNLEVHITHG